MANKKPAVKPADTNKLKNALTGRAATELRKRHLEEFEQIAERLFKEAGLTRVRRLSKEEKDYNEYLRLKKQFAEGVPDTGDDDNPTSEPGTPYDPTLATPSDPTLAA